MPRSWARFSELEQTTSTVIVPNTTVGHNRITQDSISQFSIKSTRDSSSEHINIGQVHAPRDFFQESTSKIGVNEFDVIQTRLSQVRIPQVSIPQISTSKIGFSHFNTNHFGIAEIDSSQLTSHKSTTQVSPIQVSPTQVSPTQVNIFQNEIGKVPLSSGISSKQFFSIHNSTPQIINALNNTATNIWSDLLQPQTQLDIDFQITDLPTGQLAEATITGFDNSGVPNAGTIKIDHDANGVGWFIDSTPLDNSEFTAQNADSRCVGFKCRRL